MGDVCIVKLTTAEEVIAFVEKKKYDYVLHKPHMLVQNAEGNPALYPWCILTNESTINVHERHVVFVSPAISAFKNEYVRITTGVELPTEEPIVGDAGKVLLTE